MKEVKITYMKTSLTFENIRFSIEERHYYVETAVSASTGAVGGQNMTANQIS